MHAGEMTSIEETLRELGGIATTGELMQRGFESDHLLLFARYGRIIRVRKGWFASKDIDEQVVDAVRAGGRLACLSALAYHGLAAPDPTTLHIAVHRSASRLRRAPREGVTVVVHWSRSAPSGNRQSVRVSEAVAQARACLRHAGAVGDTL